MELDVVEIPGGKCYGSSIAAFCARNGFSRAFVYDEIKRKKLRAVKWRGRTFILDADATAFFGSLPAVGEGGDDARAA